ncbi:hypothetical protein JCM10212_001818 [Sporobolomyces blumeae]
MPPHDLGLLSEVASSLDPAPPLDNAHRHGPSTSSESARGARVDHSTNGTASTSHAQWGDIAVDSIADYSVAQGDDDDGGHARDGHAAALESNHGRDGAWDRGDAFDLDPSLQQLWPELGLEPHPQPASTTHDHAACATSSEEDDDTDSGSDEEGEPGRSFVLEPAPTDSDEQIRQLKELDAQATTSLAANRVYQDEIRKLMDRFEAARKRTIDLKALVKSLSTELLAGADMRIVAPGTVEPTLPWFEHYHGKVRTSVRVNVEMTLIPPSRQDLPPNADGEGRDRYLAATRHLPWSSAEREKLKSEVAAFNQRQVAQQAAARGQDIARQIASKSQKWFVENTDGLDWEQISQVIMRRSAIDCKIQWLQNDHPLLNFGKFSKAEMTKLVDLVEVQRVRNWDEIAKQLGNNRVAWHCLKTYRSRPGQRDDWSKTEDDRLREAIRLYGENWQLVSRYTGRHSNACINRWTKSLRPTIKRGKWSREEDDTLRAAVKAVGKNWKLIAPRVTGRTDAQCRERWTNFLDPKVLIGQPWSAEEDRILLEAKEAGKSWSEISKTCFNETRTDNNCFRRYTVLNKAPRKPKAKKPKKRSRKDSDEEDDALLHEGGDLDAATREDDGTTGQGGNAAVGARKRPRRAAADRRIVDPFAGLFDGADPTGTSTAELANPRDGDIAVDSQTRAVEETESRDAQGSMGGANETVRIANRRGRKPKNG